LQATIEANPILADQAKYAELETRRDISSVLLLREMYNTDDLDHRRHLFDQAADQEASHISEVLNGTVRTDYGFDVHNGKLYLLQPNGVTDWQEMHKNGAQRAKLRAAIDPRFEPYAQIAEAEVEESSTQEEIVRRGEPAALVKLSLCGSDVMGSEQLAQIGRDPNLQRAFLRVSVFDGQKLRIYSRSIDRMALNDGRGIAGGWGVFDRPKADMAPDASSIDILKTDIILDESQMNIDDMHNLADRLVGAYDELQYDRTGKVHKAGRDPEGIDTYKFVTDNWDLMNAHMDSLCDLSARELPMAVLAQTANNIRYDIMASFKQRMDGTWVSKGSLAESVAEAGSGERAIGTQFSGCDTVVGAGLNSANSGYVNGGEADKSLMRLSGQKIRCTNTNCKKEVVVPDSDLQKGILSCKECGLTYDICTKKTSFKRAKADAAEEEESPLTKWNRQYDLKKEQEKLEKLRLAQEAELANAA
jgi:hypothetical protein